MQVVIAGTAKEVATLGASHCLKLLSDKADAVLGLATGSTPVALYMKASSCLLSTAARSI